MPVAQYPGERNWGYDGVHPFAVQNSYGGPAGLKRLVNACHRHLLAVVLDVVYNHLGPEGNYIGEYGPYFTDSYKTPWGTAINFDGPHSDDVRHYFIQNALYWFTEFHIDALRLDAVHAIKDSSATPFLEELGQEVHEKADEINRRLYLIAESDLNDARVIRSRNIGGYGLDAQWSDDFHHSLHALLTGERDGYYADFGRIENLAKAYRECFVYDGTYSRHRKRRHGNSSRLNASRQFVVCAQNHDQIGNRMQGDRLSQFVGFEKLKLAAGAVILSPFIPLLFMGEEYGETAPFLYFVSHSDPALIEGVRRGRRAGFAAIQGTPPDPQDPATFLSCKLRHELWDAGHHRVLRDFYKELIALRRNLPRIGRIGQEGLETRPREREQVLYLRLWRGGEEAILVFNFGDSPASVTFPPGRWRKRLDSADPKWNGMGSPAPLSLESDGEAEIPVSPLAFFLFVRDKENVSFTE
jgi:maltooligosyltrehalose trehalohydrolase